MVLLRLEPDSGLKTDVLQHSEKFGRRIRQDPPLQLGVPTMDLALLALRRGARADALALAAYMVDEFTIVYEAILNRWLQEILRYALPRLGAEKLAPALRVPRKHLWDAFFGVAQGFHAEAMAAIEADDIEQAALMLDHVRRIYKTINDQLVRFIQDLLTALDRAFGEDEPIKAQRGAYETIWRDRYRAWEEYSPEEQLQLTCEGMRAHYGGPTRHGEFEIFDDGDRFRLVFDLCGTGGVLRRGDPETGSPPWETPGVNRTPRPYTWGQTGVPWYCTHCSLYLEHWAAEDYGWPIRPVLFHPDPDGPTTSWLIYKGRHWVHAEDYERIGLAAPDSAPREGTAVPYDRYG